MRHTRQDVVVGIYSNLYVGIVCRWFTDNTTHEIKWNFFCKDLVHKMKISQLPTPQITMYGKDHNPTTINIVIIIVIIIYLFFYCY